MFVPYVLLNFFFFFFFLKIRECSSNLPLSPICKPEIAQHFTVCICFTFDRAHTIACILLNAKQCIRESVKQSCVEYKTAGAGVRKQKQKKEWGQERRDELGPVLPPAPLWTCEFERPDARVGFSSA